MCSINHASGAFKNPYVIIFVFKASYFKTFIRYHIIL